jgi:hypothetical protein
MTSQLSKEDGTPYNLNVAYGLVREQLLKADFSEQCLRSGAELQSDGTVMLTYLHDRYRIGRDAVVSFRDNQQPVPLRDRILILHYFTQAKGTSPTGNLIPYRDLPGGLVYYPTFVKRTLNPLAECFGEDAALLGQAGKLLGAEPGATGDASLIIYAFPYVPVNIVLWQGDDELPSQLNLLFDANINDYLTSEDVTILCETLTWRLINLARKK